VPDGIFGSAVSGATAAYFRFKGRRAATIHYSHRSGRHHRVRKKHAYNCHYFEGEKAETTISTVRLQSGWRVAIVTARQSRVRTDGIVNERPRGADQISFVIDREKLAASNRSMWIWLVGKGEVGEA